MSGSSWKIQYGDHSSASGTVGTDTVSIGGLTIQNQAIELAQKLSQGFIQGSGDGLLGLAFGSINTVQPESVATPVENMISQSDIPKTSELFTANLGSWRDANDPDQGESFYTFGYIDDATVQASGQQISYTPIDNSQGFWMFDSASASVNGQDISRDGNKAIADTGTTLALVDDSTCEAIYSAIPGASYDSASQGYIFPTDTTADNLPTVAFAVGGTQFVVNKEDLAFAAAKEGYVYGGIQSRGDSNFDILGDTFLKSIYAVSDRVLTIYTTSWAGYRLRMLSVIGTYINEYRFSTKAICASVPCRDLRRYRIWRRRHSSDSYWIQLGFSKELT